MRTYVHMHVGVYTPTYLLICASLFVDFMAMLSENATRKQNDNNRERVQRETNIKQRADNNRESNLLCGYKIESVCMSSLIVCVLFCGV